MVRNAILLFLFTFCLGAKAQQTTADIRWYAEDKTVFLLSTAAELAGLATLVNGKVDDFKGDTILLKNDIDLTEWLNGAGNNNGSGWEPIGWTGDCILLSFHGTFQGEGKKISGLWMQNRPLEEYSAGFFGCVGKYGSVSELTIEIDNTNGRAVNGRFHAGGLAGFNYGTISDCTVQMKMPRTIAVRQTEESDRMMTYSGGLIAFCDGVVTRCRAAVNVAGYNVGGLIGDNYGEVTDCHATGFVQGEEGYVGGLIGCTYQGRVENCYATGTVEGIDSTVGGLLGLCAGLVVRSYATGNVTNDDSTVGGLVGRSTSSGEITDCYATGNVKGTRYVGGLIGSHMSSVTGSYSTGNVSGDHSVGGLVGYCHSGFITNSYAEAYVEGAISVGGLVGECSSNSSVNTSYARAEVVGKYNGSSIGVGGLIGDNTNSTIENCYAFATVTGDYRYVGGLIGENRGGIVTHCYAVATTVAGSDLVGGFMGFNSNSLVTGCFYDATVSGDVKGIGMTVGSAGVLGLPTSKMKTNLAGWDFERVWALDTDINDGYPYFDLRNYVASDTPPELQEGGRIYSVGGHLVIETLYPCTLWVYTLTGQQVIKLQLTYGSAYIPLSKGFYIVQMNEKARKVMVR